MWSAGENVLRYTVIILFRKFEITISSSNLKPKSKSSWSFVLSSLVAELEEWREGWRRDREFFLRRAHEHTDRGRGLVVRRRGLVHRFRLVDPEKRRDGGGPDVENPGVCDLTVNLHHHFVVAVPYDALCWGRKQEKKGNGTISSLLARWCVISAGIHWLLTQTTIHLIPVTTYPVLGLVGMLEPIPAVGRLEGRVTPGTSHQFIAGTHWEDEKDKPKTIQSSPNSYSARLGTEDGGQSTIRTTSEYTVKPWKLHTEMSELDSLRLPVGSSVVHCTAASLWLTCKYVAKVIVRIRSFGQSLWYNRRH